MSYGSSSYQQDDQSTTSAFKIPDLGDVFQTPSAKVQRTALYIDEVNSTETKAKVPEGQWVTTAAYIYATINRTIKDRHPERDPRQVAGRRRADHLRRHRRDQGDQ